MARTYKPDIPKRTYEHRARLVASELLRAPLIGNLYSIPEFTDDKELVLFLGKSFIEGSLRKLGGKEIAHIDNFRVPTGLHGKGIGERLLKAFTAEAKQMGCQELWSSEVASRAVGLRAKVFGPDNLVFYDGDYPEQGFLPIDVAQALSLNDRMDKVYAATPPADGTRQGYIGIYVNLDQVDTSTWELPFCSETIIEENAPYLLVSA